MVSVIHELMGLLLTCIGFYTLTLKSDKRLTLLSGILALCWAMIYYSIESYTAAAIVVSVAIRIFLSLKYKKSWSMTHLFFATSIIIGLLTYESVKDLFPVLASMLGTYAFFQCEQSKMRFVLIAAAAAWIVHNVMAGFIMASLHEAIAIGIHASTIYRINYPKDGLIKVT